MCNEGFLLFRVSAYSHRLFAASGTFQPTSAPKELLRLYVIYARNLLTKQVLTGTRRECERPDRRRLLGHVSHNPTGWVAFCLPLVVSVLWKKTLADGVFCTTIKSQWQVVKNKETKLLFLTFLMPSSTDNTSLSSPTTRWKHTLFAFLCFFLAKLSEDPLYVTMKTRLVSWSARPSTGQQAEGTGKRPSWKHSVNKLLNVHYYGVNTVPLDR